MLAPIPPTQLRSLAAASLLAAFVLTHPIHAQTQPADSPTSSAAISSVNKAKLAQNYGKLPLSFEANRGQSDPKVKFLSRGNGYALFLTNGAAVLSLTKSGPNGRSAKTAPGFVNGHDFSRADESRKRNEALAPEGSPAADTIEMQLANSNPNAQVAGEDQLPGHANYFLGNDPAKWHTNVPTYARVQYNNVYNGIDLVYYGNQRQLEYDFVVAPHADPKTIQLHFSGAQKLKLARNGDLEVIAKNGQIAFHKPVLYQEKDGQRQPIEGKFTLKAKNKVAFQTGQYDHSRALVIDPTLAYSTYLGGSGNPTGDSANAIAVDANGSVYVAGVAGSTNFPVSSNPWQMTDNNDYGQTTAFVSRLNSTGTALVYSTFLGGSGNNAIGDGARAIAVDGYGNAYIAGFAGSPGTNASCSACQFPTTPGAFQTINKANPNWGTEAFVTKLSADGTQLIYSTFVGGSGLSRLGDTANGIALDNEGDAYIAGTTFSTDFPLTSGAIQTANNAAKISGSNLFVTKLNPSGTSLSYSTYLGGSGFYRPTPIGESGSDTGTAVAVDGSGNAYVTGYANSPDFPVTVGAYQPTNKAASNYLSNAIVTKIDPTGTQKIYSTYLGGAATSWGDEGLAIAVDASGYAYVAGQAASQDFPTTQGAFQTSLSNQTLDQYIYGGFVTKLNPTGTELSYSTLLTGSTPGGDRYGGDVTTAIALDKSGDAYVTGVVYSTDFPITPGAYQPSNNEQQSGGANYYSGNTFMTEFNPSGTGQVYSTYLGGSGRNASGGDYGNAIAVDGEGNAYIAGSTLSSNFPITKGAFQFANNAQASGASGNSNAFIAKFGEATTYTLAGSKTTVITSAATQNQGNNVTFTVTVKSVTGGETPSGTVGLSIDGALAEFLTLGGSGSVTYETSTLSPTTHTIAARYYGDVFFSASQGSVTETILGVPAAIKPISGASQTTTYAVAFAKPLVAYVEDSLGNPVSNATVTFNGAGLKLSATTAKTGTNGEAEITVTPTAAGVFFVTASVAGVATTVNFNTLEVKQAPLTVTAENESRDYGQSNPTFPCTISGFVHGDTSAVVSGVCAATTKATPTSPVGTYPIVPTRGTLAAANYAFYTFVNGTLTVTDIGKSSTPSLSLAAGTYTEKQTVTITDPIAGATIYYTTDGTTPTSASTKYTTPIPVTESETIEANAVANGYGTSATEWASYVIVGSPTALGAPATAVATPDATLNAIVNTFGLTGTYYFQYGTSSTALTTTTAKTALSASTAPVAASAKLTTLKSKTTYYFQVIVATAGGTALGPVISFTTD